MKKAFPPPPRMPQPGEVLYVGPAASVQFASPIFFRVIRVHNWTTYEGWVWVDGYELGPDGDAVERRSIFVQLAGLRRLDGDRRGRNAGLNRASGPAPAPARSPASPSTPKRRTRS